MALAIAERYKTARKVAHTARVKTGHFFWRAAYIGERTLRVGVALVPAGAIALRAYNSFKLVTSGVGVGDDVLADMHDKVDPMLDRSIPQQVAGLAGETAIAAAAVGEAAADLGSDLAHVVGSHWGGETTETVGAVAADAAVIAGAGWVGWQIVRDHYIPQPPKQ